MIITTNLGFALTAAFLDRLTHKAYIVMCDWESYRLKESLKKKSPAKRDKECRVYIFLTKTGAGHF